MSSAALADGRDRPGRQLAALTDLVEQAIDAPPAKAPDLSPLEASISRTSWATGSRSTASPSGWEHAPTLVDAGLDVDWLDRRSPR